MGIFTQLFVNISNFGFVMKYQRLHIRVPGSGDVILMEEGEVKVESIVINMSVGGIGITIRLLGKIRTLLALIGIGKIAEQTGSVKAIPIDVTVGITNRKTKIRKSHEQKSQNKIHEFVTVN